MTFCELIAVFRNAMVSYVDKSKLIVFVVLVRGALNVKVASFADNRVVKAEAVVSEPKAVLRRAIVSYDDKSKDIVFVVLINHEYTINTRY